MTVLIPNVWHSYKGLHWALYYLFYAHMICQIVSKFQQHIYLLMIQLFTHLKNIFLY